MVWFGKSRRGCVVDVVENMTYHLGRFSGEPSGVVGGEDGLLVVGVGVDDRFGITDKLALAMRGTTVDVRVAVALRRACLLNVLNGCMMSVCAVDYMKKGNNNTATSEL